MKIKCKYRTHKPDEEHPGWLINTFENYTCHVLTKDGSVRQLSLNHVTVKRWE